jgi:hypothetical protein
MRARLTGLGPSPGRRAFVINTSAEWPLAHQAEPPVSRSTRRLAGPHFRGRGPEGEKRSRPFSTCLCRNRTSSSAPPAAAFRMALASGREAARVAANLLKTFPSSQTRRSASRFFLRRLSRGFGGFEGARVACGCAPGSRKPSPPSSKLVGVLAPPGFDPWRKPVNRTGARTEDRKRSAAAGPVSKLRGRGRKGFG